MPFIETRCLCEVLPENWTLMVWMPHPLGLYCGKLSGLVQ